MSTSYDLQTPEEGIVVVALEELDSNSDGKVSLSEVRDMSNKIYTSERYSRRQKGAAMALANLLDSDASGFIERNEMERAASILVTELGGEQLVSVIEFFVRVRTPVDGIEYLKNVGRPIVFPAIDRDGDGQINQPERATLVSLNMFHWMQGALNRLLDASDTNGDGVVTEAEFNQWFEELDSSPIYFIWSLVAYARVAAHGGFEMADSFADSDTMY